MSTSGAKFWLLKAEPDTRIVKGKDVKVGSKLTAVVCQCCSNTRRSTPHFGHANITREIQFSVDDFEHVGTSPWEGVRNYEARNLMKEMAVGDKVISHSFDNRFTLSYSMILLVNENAGSFLPFKL